MKKELELKTVEWLINNTKPQRKYFESFTAFVASIQIILSSTRISSSPIWFLFLVDKF